LNKVIIAIVACMIAIVALPISASAKGADQTSSEAYKPSAEPPLPSKNFNVPIQYIVQESMYKNPDSKTVTRVVEDLSSISLKLGLTSDEIKFSNPDKDLANLSAGESITVPPEHGAVYQIKPGDTLSLIAYMYQADVGSIASFNGISNPDSISPDQVIIIPGAKLPPIAPPTPVVNVAVAAISSAVVSATSPAIAPAVPSSPPMAYAGGNRFAFGYCTWYVFNRRPIPWLGNANEWWGNARSSGFTEGSTPRAGAILVENFAPLGHVAYVESAGAGSFTVSEMNYSGWDRVDSRVIANGAREIVGFIY
jgi:surface antigen